MYYYQHNIGDFDRATRHLTRIERSIYRDLIDVYYDTEQALALDVSALCRKIVARTEEEKEAVLAVLDEFFHETPSGWFHDRCEEEIAEYRKKSGQASVAGKASAAARAQRRMDAMTIVLKPNGNPTDVERTFDGRTTDVVRNVNEPSTPSQPTNNQEPITSNQEQKKVKPTVPPCGETAEVFAYWQQKMNHPSAKLDDKRAKAIKGRIKDGYTVGDLCRAVDGCKFDPFSQGQNDRQQVYDDIELICRDGPKVDKFIRIAEQGPANGRSPAQNETISALQRVLERRKNHG